MKNVKIFFILISIISVFSCRKAIKENPNYEGYWRCGETCYPSITIGEDGDGSFKYTDPQTDCQKRGNKGKAKIFNHTLKIGVKGFKIDLEPTLIDTINLGYNNLPPQRSCMKMILDGNSYYKVIQ